MSTTALDVRDTTDPDMIARAKAAGCPIEHFEIAQPQTVGTYHAKAQAYRDGGPIWMNSLAQGFWVLSTYELVREMYRTPDIFTSDSITPTMPEQAFALKPTNVNPPEHMQYRKILNPWFTPRAVDAMQDDVRETARRLVAEVAPKGRADVIKAFCMILPTEIFAKRVGLPVEDVPDLIGWVEAFFQGFSGEEALLTGDPTQPKMQAGIASIATYYAEVVADRRANPRDPQTDFFTDLANQTIDGEPITDATIQNISLLMTIAGLDTTRAQLGWLMWHLAEHPDDRRRLTEDPSITPLAVEESLRYHAMMFGNGRKVGRDVDWHGVRMKKGDMVFGLNSAANRDPKMYENPDTFQIDRKIKHHVGFADGPHKCLGLHLARAEMIAALDEWHKVIPEYEVDLEGDIGLTERGVQLALHALPLKWDV